MLETAPFSAWVYWPHVIFGIASAAIVLVAIFAPKGSRLHRKSGQLFAVAMTIAAITAIAFVFVRFAVPPVFSAISVLYGLGAGILALRIRKGSWRIAEYGLALIPALLALSALALFVIVPLTSPEPPPLIFYHVSAIVVGVFGYFFWTDVRYLRSRSVSPFQRYRRHALRMSLAAAETVRAPLMSFGPPILGPATGPVYFTAPFLLIPLIYFAAMPAWVKRGELQKARKLEAGRKGGALVSEAA